MALAAVLTGRIETRGRNIGVIASGGNVDAALFAGIAGGGDEQDDKKEK